MTEVSQLSKVIEDVSAHLHLIPENSLKFGIRIFEFYDRRAAGKSPPGLQNRVADGSAKIQHGTDAFEHRLEFLELDHGAHLQGVDKIEMGDGARSEQFKQLAARLKTTFNDDSDTGERVHLHSRKLRRLGDRPISSSGASPEPHDTPALRAVHDHANCK